MYVCGVLYIAPCVVEVKRLVSNGREMMCPHCSLSILSMWGILGRTCRDNSSWQPGRVVKAMDLKSIGVTRVSPNLTAVVFLCTHSPFVIYIYTDRQFLARPTDSVQIEIPSRSRGRASANNNIPSCSVSTIYFLAEPYPFRQFCCVTSWFVT